MRRVAVISRHEALAEQLRPDFEAVRVSPEQCEAESTGGAGPAPDAYLVDATEGDRLAFVARLASYAERPIVVLGSDSRPPLASEYLETGADAYLPCGAPAEEWTARIRALTRRNGNGHPSEAVDYLAGDVAVMRDSRRVLVRGVDVRLTRTEFNLLLALAEHMDEVVPHRKLMAQVWGPEYLSARHYLRVYVRRLREKLEVDPEQPTLLVAERGRGYMLRSTPLPAPPSP